jgi:hypothetical protein
MMKPLLAAMALALSASVAFAAEDNYVTSKAMKDHPGTSGGSTANATAKPDSGSLSEKQMQLQPGVNSDRTGKTATPNAKPQDGSLAGGEMEQNIGAHK